MSKPQQGCPVCPHNLGYHVTEAPGIPSQPKGSDRTLWCAWCDGFCVNERCIGFDRPTGDPRLPDPVLMPESVVVPTADVLRVCREVMA
jgi:hypothetical protein